MKVYILASLDNISFAEKLLSNIRNAKIISKPSINEIGSDINVALKRKMESADVVLAIIDEKFSDSVSLNLELQLAQMSVRENRNKVLIPVVLNKADVPKCIEGTLYIDCISDSEQDLYKTQLMIEKVLTHRKYIIRKGNLKEKNSRTSSMIISNGKYWGQEYYYYNIRNSLCDVSFCSSFNELFINYEKTMARR